jgi:hypothetical protein
MFRWLRLRYILWCGVICLSTSVLTICFRSMRLKGLSPHREAPLLDDVLFNTITLACHAPQPPFLSWRLTAHKAFYRNDNKDVIMLDQALIEYPFCTINAQSCQVDRKNQSLCMKGGVKTVLTF